MKSFKIPQYGAIVGIIVLSVLLYFAPNKPPIKVIKEENVSNLSIDEKIQQAASLVYEGKEPMKGIMMLREVLEQDSLNTKAHYHLGVFSVQSGQLDKAIMRFNKVLALDSTYFDAMYYLGHVYATQGQKELALKQFEKFKSVVNDKALKEQAEKYISELKKS